MTSCILCVWAGTGSSDLFAAKANEASRLVQIGVTQYQSGDYLDAIASWQQALVGVDADNFSHQSILLENLARAHRQTGQFPEEIDYWEAAIERHERQGDFQALGRARTEAAQAYGRLGQHRRAITLLCGEQASLCASDSSLQIARTLADISGEAAALASLGEAYRLAGNYEQALSVLEQSLSIVETDLNSPLYTALVLNSLGNTQSALAQVSDRRAIAAAQRGDRQDEQFLTERSATQTQQAIAFFQRSVEVAQSSGETAAQSSAQLNLIPLYQRTSQPNAARQAGQTARQLISTLPSSQAKAFDMLTLAGYLELPIKSRQCPDSSVVSEQTQLLEEALSIANNIHSSRAESFALGQLGNLYERCGDYTTALTLTQNARLAADQDRSARDSLYLWAWQQGRILAAQQQPEAAAIAYRQALDILDTIRTDILSANRDLQFDFRDRVEPLYREFAQLKLAEVPQSMTVAATAQPNIDAVLATLDSLKLAELQNYFASDCVISPATTRAEIVDEQPATTVISTAILSNRLAVIASFPNGQRQVEWLEIAEADLIEQVNDYRISLESGRFQRGVFTPNSQLYNLLIRPFEAQLSSLKVDTLVFVNEGILRSLPMAALYDGRQYLIERYAIATTPSLTLTASESLNRRNLSALIVGLSEDSQVGQQQYPALNKVEAEIAAVKAQFPNSKVLRNEAFSASNLQQTLQAQSYRILHVATHGSFGAEPEDNFIVTGQKNDDETNKVLTISELDALIRSVSAVDKAPIDLLTLTACETSIGDDRATLGLAGVAVRAGVKSAIASLWSVDDSATADLISRFYSHLLDGNLSKAEALRRAQIEVIQAGGIAQHPYYWAPFILIGNWL